MENVLRKGENEWVKIFVVYDVEGVELSCV